MAGVGNRPNRLRKIKNILGRRRGKSKGKSNPFPGTELENQKDSFLWKVAAAAAEVTLGFLE
jgi:hypothetical protein